VNKVSALDSEGWFQRPVSEKDAPNYHSVIKTPMCFDMMHSKISSGMYVTWQEIVRDFELIFNNAMLYNQKRSRVHKQALVILRAGMKQLLECELEGRKALEVLNPNGKSRVIEAKPEARCVPEAVLASTDKPEEYLTASHQDVGLGYSSFEDDVDMDRDARLSEISIDESPVEVIVLEPKLSHAHTERATRDYGVCNG